MVYYIGTYDIDDPETFRGYPPRVLALLGKYGGEVLASDTSAYVVEGTARRMNAIIRFPSKEAALGLYHDPEYQEAKRIRQSSTSHGTMVIVEEVGLRRGGSLSATDHRAGQRDDRKPHHEDAVLPRGAQDAATVDDAKPR